MNAPAHPVPFKEGAILIRNETLSVSAFQNRLSVQLSLGVILSFDCQLIEGVLVLRHLPLMDVNIAFGATLAAIEAAFLCYPSQDKLHLQVADSLSCLFLPSGVAVQHGKALIVFASMFWQLPGRWIVSLPSDRYPMQRWGAEKSQMPARAPKVQGLLYERYIPWMGCDIQLRVVDIERDLALFNQWMNEPRVAAFWEESGDLDYHRRFLERRLQDPGVIPIVGCYDGEPFGYFEVYWVKEDRLAAYCTAEDFDRGFHLLIGNVKFRGRSSVCAWFPSLVHFMFLDDCRTQRVLAEPRSDNQKLLRCADRLGFTREYDFDFPHKRATLISQTRSEFFERGGHLSGRGALTVLEA